MLPEFKETDNRYARHQQTPIVPDNLFLKYTENKSGYNPGMQSSLTSILNKDSGIQTDNVRFCQGPEGILPNIPLVFMPLYPQFLLPNFTSYRYQGHWQNQYVHFGFQNARQPKNFQTQTNYNLRYDSIPNEALVFSPITSASPTHNILNLNNIIRNINYSSRQLVEDDIGIPKLVANDEVSINAFTSNNPNRSQMRVQIFLKRHDILKEIADVLFLGTADEIDNFTFSGSQLQALLIVLNARKCPETQVTFTNKS